MNDIKRAADELTAHGLQVVVHSAAKVIVGGTRRAYITDDQFVFQNSFRIEPAAAGWLVRRWDAGQSSRDFRVDTLPEAVKALLKTY
ncbi:MAG: hypothetical protein ACLFVJ_12320 [Persicimonas sp.]